MPAHFTRHRWTLSQGLTASDTATREQPSIWGENIIFGHASPHSLARGIPQICPGWGMEPPQQNKGVGVGVVMSRRKQNGCSDTSPCHHARGASHSRKHAPHQIHQGESISEPCKGHQRATKERHSGARHSRIRATIHPVRCTTACCMTQNRTRGCTFLVLGVQKGVFCLCKVLIYK